MKLNELKNFLNKEFPKRQEGNFNGFMERIRLDNVQLEDIKNIVSPAVKKKLRAREKKQKEIANRNGLCYMRREKYLTLAGVANVLLDLFIEGGYKYDK